MTYIIALDKLKYFKIQIVKTVLCFVSTIILANLFVLGFCKDEIGKNNTG